MMKRCGVAVVGAFLFVAVWLASQVARAGGKEKPVIPPEMKVLEKRIGSWKTVTRVKAADWTPEAGESKGEEKIELALQGRFIQGRVRTQAGNVEAIWLATYDAGAKAYRVWYFNSEGHIVDAGGKWDARTNTMTWMNVPQPGITSVSRWRFTGDDTFEWDLIAKDRSGKVYLDMEGKLTRSE
jgi:uncharacterized protein DUF1579